MTKQRIALLLCCWLLFAGYVSRSSSPLPERIATHFSMDGQPNGWMTRAEHVRFTIIMGIGASALVVVVFAFIGWCGEAGLNIPHKAYWVAPERREATFDFIQLQGVIFSCLLVGFIAGVNYTIVAANLRTPPVLPGSDVGWLSGGFAGVTLVWVAFFIGRFFRKPA